MNPLAAMANMMADLAPATPAAAGTDAAGGFADALQRAGGGPRPDGTRPPAGPSRRDRAAAAEAAGEPPADRPTEPLADASADPSGEGLAPSADTGEQAASAADGDGTRPDRAASRDDEAAAGIPIAFSQAELHRGTAAPGPGAETAGQAAAEATADPISGTRGPASGHAALPGPAATAAGAHPATAVGAADAADATGPAGPARDAGRDSTRPTRPARNAAADATTAAGQARQAAVLPPAATTQEAPGPGGVASRRPGAVAAPIVGRATAPSAGPAGSTELRATAPDVRASADVRAAPQQASGAATAPGAGEAIELTQAAGPGQGFEDALLAAQGQGAEGGTAIASSPGAPAAAGGVRPITLPIAAPVFSPAFPQALGQQLALALRMDLGQAELILSPAELGPVRVELSLDGNAASVQFAAPNAETRQALEQSLADLRDLFAEQGLSLADTHVGPGFHRDGDERPADGSDRARADRRSVASIDGAIRPTGARIRPDALVDLYA